MTRRAHADVPEHLLEHFLTRLVFRGENVRVGCKYSQDSDAFHQFWRPFFATLRESDFDDSEQYEVLLRGDARMHAEHVPAAPGFRWGEAQLRLHR